MMLFNKIEWKQHPADPVGKQGLLFFPNGFGASIITGPLFYTDHDHPFELAVLKGSPAEFSLTYETSITDDVLGHLDKDAVEEVLKVISELEPCDA